MKKFIQGVCDKVICIKMEATKITVGGIHIPETVNQDPQLTCKVISVGEDVKSVKPDDIIFCHRNGGMDIMVDGDIMKCLKENEIYGIVTAK